MGSGCLASRLAHYAALSAQEKHTLSVLEEQERHYRRGAVIHRENDPVRELAIVQKGWLASYVYLGNGTRQIMRFYFPGDIVGLSNLAYGEATDCLAAVTEATLCPLDKDKLATLFVEQPRLAALVFTLVIADRVALADRLASIGRTSARARVASLLCEIAARLRVMEGHQAEFAIPLTQEDIGDATGLTAVHVNRMMRGLVDDGLIERNGNVVRILDERRLGEEGFFSDRYAKLDTSWVPAAR